MTINFALSLSVEGIELLHRVERGWRRLGTAQIGSASFDADLTELRQKAEALAPDGLHSKLIIPRDQIKFTAIDSTQTTDADVHAVLEGATPYTLDELVIDCERFGGRTHIAAVSRDTLQEAEEFAAAHGFHPVAFVAIPEPFTFQSEVFFGPTTAMPDILGAAATVDRDALPVMIVGTRIKSRLLVMGDNDTFESADSLADLISGAAPEDTVEKRAPVDADPAPVAPMRQQIWIDAVPASYHPKPVATPPAPVAVVIATTPTFAQMPIFDRVIAEVHPKPVRKPKPALVAAPKAMAASPKPSVLTAPPRPAPAVTVPKRTSPLLIAASVGALLAVGGGVYWASQQDATIEVATPVQADLAPAPAPVTADISEPVTLPQPALEAGPEIPTFEIAGLTSAPIGAAPAMPASAQSPVSLETPQSVVPVVADALPLPMQAPPAPPTVVVAETTPAPALGRVPSPDEAQAFYDATGVWQRAPRFFDEPSGVLALGFERPAVTTAPARIAAPVTLAPVAGQTELVFSAPADPPPPDVVFARDDAGFILATPEGTLTPEGALVFTGLPELAITARPTLTADDLNRMALLAPAPEGVVLIAGRPDFTTPLRPVDLQGPPEALTEIAVAEQPATAIPVAPAGGVALNSLELQADGSVGLDTDVVEARGANDLRPQLRPNGLSPVLPDNNPDITDILTEVAAQDGTLRFDNSTSLAVVTSLRPNDRPSGFDDVVAAAQARQVTAQIASVAAAVAPVAPAAPVAPQNLGPVPGGVAVAATQEDVIRLRDINVIGIYGRPNARRALVRLSNGQYVRVEVGSALDGGQVTAIGDTSVNYVKRGRTYAVEIPTN